MRGVLGRPVVKYLLLAVAAAPVLLLLFQADRLIRRAGVESETVATPSVGGSADAPSRDLEIVTLLPFDAIPAISNPDVVGVQEADAVLEPDERVLGVSLNGGHRAYSVPQLSRHEIVNDIVGGVPLAATW